MAWAFTLLELSTVIGFAMVSESPRERAMYKGKTTVDFFTRTFCQGITEAKVEKVLEAIMATKKSRSPSSREVKFCAIISASKRYPLTL